MKKQGSVVKKWFTYIFGTMLLIFIVFEICFVISVSKYYYNGIGENLISRAKSISEFYYDYVAPNSTDFYSDSKKLVEGFEYKNDIELQIIDYYGNVLYSTLGFEIKEKVDEEYINDAKNGIVKSYVNNTHNGNDERVIAVISSLHNKDGSIAGYVRYITSLTLADAQIKTIFFISLIIILIILLFVIFSSMYFIKSIVKPVNEVKVIADNIANGNFESRIDKKYNYEVGELCNSINNMASQLSEMDKMKNQFISMISHELKTPLTAIKGWSETMKSLDSDEFELRRRGLEIIDSETDRLSEMVNELLDISIIQSGEIVIKKNKCNISEILHKCIILADERVKKAGLKVLSSIENDLFFEADEGRLIQVFINIIDNSVKHSYKDGTIKIYARQIEKEGIISIVFRDWGGGISPDELEKVKQKFYKAKSNNKRGTGLGLSICDDIIKKHSGTLEIYSGKFKGTAVVIKLKK